jgi:hypothetical protein
VSAGLFYAVAAMMYRLPCINLPGDRNYPVQEATLITQHSSIITGSGERRCCFGKSLRRGLAQV